LLRRFIEGFEDTRANAIPFAERPVVEPVEEFADALVGYCQREELAVPQCRKDPTLRHLNCLLYDSLVVSHRMQVVWVPPRADSA
jgi:hypothetical protein